MRRRLALGIALVVGALAVVAVVLAIDAESGTGLEPAANGSTLTSTWIDPDGNGALEVGPGEPLVDRTELAPAAPPVRTLATFAQLSDAHIRDEESPARATLADRLSPRVAEAFRAQEALSPQVLAATMRSIEAVEADAVLETGDLIDSAQLNELRQAITLLNGGEVDPDSGALGYDGVQELSNPDPFIYRPDLDSPRFPGLLDRAQEAFESPGLSAPWFPVLGNHDLLVQGEVPSTPRLRQIATGDRELVRIDPGLSVPQGATELTPRLVNGYLARGLPGATRRVPADPQRRHLGPREVVSKLREASAAGGSGPRLDYSFDPGQSVRVIVLDLVSRNGGAAGLVARAQIDWLRGELRAAGNRFVIVASHQPLASSTGGERILGVLDRSAGVIAAISGHTHANSIVPRPTSAGGYWLVATASLADYPQQARGLRIVETEDGVALETWMLDSAPSALADSARELAYLDAGGGRPQGHAGNAADRNARLFLSRATIDR